MQRTALRAAADARRWTNSERQNMRTLATSLCIALVLSVTIAPADPLAGKWTLNVGRSHYGGGAEARRQETFTCQADEGVAKCVIESVRADGRTIVGAFTAAYDGKPHPVAGIPDVDQVTLQKQNDFIADATYSGKGKPVFGYRAIRSDDGRSLTIVSVDPTTRVVGSSVVVYDQKWPRPDADAAVRAVLAAQVEAWNRGDLDGFMAGYWKSPDLVFFSNGATTRGWQATLDRYRRRYQAEGKQMGTLDFPGLDILTLGTEAAMARGRWRLKMPDGRESSGMTSVIFRKLPEGWRIVHDHSSSESN